MDDISKFIEDAGEALYYKYGLALGMNGAECERIAEIALEATIPGITAQALREEAVRELGLSWLEDPYVHDWLTQEKLVNRADELEKR